MTLPRASTLANDDPDRPTYPDLEDEYGRDPGRWLHGDLGIEPILPALTEPDEIRAWLDIEAEHRARRGVIAALNKRLAAVREDQTGEQRDRSDGGEKSAAAPEAETAPGSPTTEPAGDGDGRAEQEAGADATVADGGLDADHIRRIVASIDSWHALAQEHQDEQRERGGRQPVLDALEAAMRGETA